MSLVSLLPALEAASLCLLQPLATGNLRCLLEALAWRSHLKDLTLHTAKSDDYYDADQAEWPFPDMSALAALRSLTS